MWGEGGVGTRAGGGWEKGESWGINAYGAEKPRTPTPVSSNALVSHVDVVFTLATLLARLGVAYADALPVNRHTLCSPAPAAAPPSW